MTPEEYQKIKSKQKISDKAENFQLLDIEQEVKGHLSEIIKDFQDDLSQEFLENKIAEYVDTHCKNWKIDEFTNSNGDIDVLNLKKTLKDRILNRGILEEPLQDKKIDEIRINGRWVEVVDNTNKSSWLKDINGNRACFSSPEEQKTMLARVLFNSKTSLNDTYKLVNGNTIEGYRVSITYNTAVAHSKIPEENGYCTATIRKFLAKPFTLQELVKRETINEDIGKFCSLAIPVLNVFCVGKTFSGKTSFLRTLCREIPDDLRVISIQDPLENELRRYNKKNELVNDCIIWLADDDQESGVIYNNTNQNLLTHALRNAPEMVSINEIRRDSEFHNAFIIGQAGHIVNSSFHSGTGEEACKIFTNRLIGITKQDYVVAMEDVTSFIDIVICMKIIGNKRRVKSVCEILGHDGYKPLVNELYRFKVDDVSDTGEVMGNFEHVGKMSDALVDKFLEAGISKKKMEFVQNL